MITLKRNDRLPIVAAMQKMLNESPATNRYLDVDGVFGKNTRQSVLDFQKKHLLGTDGVAGEKTWDKLLQLRNEQVIDSVDITEKSDRGFEDADLENTRSTLLLSYGMCNGVPAVMNRIVNKATLGKVVLLRFHGHGSPGDMSITDGYGTGLDSYAALDNRLLKQYFKDLIKIRPIFSPLGSIQLHGCKVARGSNGRKLVRQLATIWNVPVSASPATQYAGGSSTYKFEGVVFTAFPSGMGLNSWAQMAMRNARCEMP